MMPMITRHADLLVCLAVALSAALAPCSARADATRFGLDAEYLHDNNVTRGPTGADQRSDDVLSLEMYGARSLLLGMKSGLVARAGLRLAEHLTFGDLSHVVATARVGYRLQPSPGYGRPWIELTGAGQWLKHRDSDLRDGIIASAAIGVGSHLTDRIRITVNAGLERRSANDAPVYDLARSRVWATLDYRVGLSTVVYGNLSHVAGDHVFNAVSAQGVAWLSPYYEVSAPDPALAEEFAGVAPTAYRLDATTFVTELGVNFPLGGNRAIDLSGSYFDAEADRGPGTYDGAMLRIGYLYRFR